MPLHEGKHNVENRIKIPDVVKNSVIFSTPKTVDALVDLINSANGAVAIDGWYGVDFKGLVALLKEKGAQAQFVHFSSVYKPMEEIKAYRKPFLTDDPSFGYANLEGRIIDIIDQDKLGKLKSELKKGVVVYGYGAALPEIFDSYDKTIYLDMTKQTMLWQFWDGKLVTFACEEPDMKYGWKDLYYCDYYLLYFHKNFVIERMDYYIEAITLDTLKIMPRKSYDEIVKTLVRYPVKEVEIYQPSNWGGYRYKDLWDIPGLAVFGWNKQAGSELSVIIDIDAEETLTIPFNNLMQYPLDLVGKHVHETYPHLFPLDAWLNDGYFPEKVPQERRSMPVHNHPSSDYVKQHFGEPLGRYETYYITEAYEGACTLMGFHEDANLDEWEAKCRESNNATEIPDWKDYVVIWESMVGDLYLIPPGTDHGTGGNQMVLELDTCPSISGTEYSFFSHAYARNTFDDNKKTMTAPPFKMHLDHSFDNSKCRRKSYIEKNHRARPTVFKWTKDYSVDRYSSLPEMPFEIERIHFQNKGEYDTEGKFCHVATLTMGKNVKVYSKANPELCTNINLYQSVVIPASFGEYVVEGSGDGGMHTITLIRWKKG